MSGDYDNEKPLPTCTQPDFTIKGLSVIHLLSIALITVDFVFIKLVNKKFTMYRST